MMTEDELTADEHLADAAAYLLRVESGTGGDTPAELYLQLAQAHALTGIGQQLGRLCDELHMGLHALDGGVTDLGAELKRSLQLVARNVGSRA